MNRTAASCAAAFAMVLATFCALPLNGQGTPPKYDVDPSWPRPMPDKWVTGAVTGVCADAQDHMFIVNQGNLTENELDAGHQAPAVIEFDPEGDVINSWGDREILPEGIHGCFVDYQNNVWISGSKDGVIQKYAHDGKKLLLQIGTKGIADSSNGTINGIALNSSHTGLYKPSSVAVDPTNGEIYVADGEESGRNHRVAIANEGLDYVGGRRGNRIQLFDKTGNFKKDILIPYEKRSQYEPGAGHVPRAWGTAEWVGFSADRAQEFMFVLNEDNEQVDVLDHGSGKILSSFGRAGHQVGELTFAHSLAVDS